MSALEPDPDWPTNYFNYFTEIEERFRVARGTGLFLLSPLDWALIENWKNAGIPLEAVLLGIDEAFEKWRAKRVRTQNVNSIAYCAQAVAKAAKNFKEPRVYKPQPEAPFANDEVQRHLATCASAVRDAGFPEIGAAVEQLAGQLEVNVINLEQLEQRLTALEDKLVAEAKTKRSDEELFQMRESLTRELAPYRGKMTADQLAMLERRYMDTAVLESAKLPRLSLFYIR